MDIKNDNFQLTPQQILEIRNDALNRYIKPINTSFQSYSTLGQQGVKAISDAESVWTSVANFNVNVSYGLANMPKVAATTTPWKELGLYTQALLSKD